MYPDHIPSPRGDQSYFSIFSIAAIIYGILSIFVKRIDDGDAMLFLLFTSVLVLYCWYTHIQEYARYAERLNDQISKFYAHSEEIEEKYRKARDEVYSLRDELEKIKNA